MTYEPVCVDCDGVLTFDGIVWRHVERGVGHAPVPRRAGGTIGPGTEYTAAAGEYFTNEIEDWVLPTRGETR